MRNLSSFQNVHQGETIIVCGCGESLNDLERPESFITIGVNDVGRLFDPTHIVVLNPRSQFTGNRFRHVENSRAEYIFTQLDLGLSHPGVVKFRLGTRGGTDFSDPNVLHYTRNSPYAALCLAIHMGARRIGLIGVDFTNNHFHAETGAHPLRPQLPKINEEYGRLASAAASRGIELVNLSRKSLLEAIPKTSQTSFIHAARSSGKNPGMNARPATTASTPASHPEKIRFRPLEKHRPLKVVHIARTNCAGALWNLHNILQKYTDVRSRVITASNVTNGLLYPVDVLLSNRASTAQLIENADILHFHNWLDKQSPEMAPHREILRNKPSVLQFHSEASVLRPDFPGRDPVTRKDMLTLVVAQKQARFYPRSIRVPNLVDIHDKKLSPGPFHPGRKPRVLYTPTDTKSYTDYKTTCRGKGYEQTAHILKSLEKSGSIEAVVRTSVPYRELMVLRQDADILIDECVTGGYHLTSLEGLAQGLATIAHLDRESRRVIREITGCAEWELPWIDAPMDRLRETLLFLADNPLAVSAYREAGRKWMERYWSPATMVRHYLEVYARTLDREASETESARPANRPGAEPRETSHPRGAIDSMENQSSRPAPQSKGNGVFYRIPGRPNPVRSEDYPQTVWLNAELLSKKAPLNHAACHILGNGPSIGKFDLSLLASQTLIGVNATPLLHDSLGRATDYYCISDRRFFNRSNAARLIQSANGSIKVFAGYCDRFTSDPGINYVKIRDGDGFSIDITRGFHHACSVALFAAQLALWIGCGRIYLHGCEFDYRNGRFFTEKKPEPHDEAAYTRIRKIAGELSEWLNRRGGFLTVVGPSRLVGDFGVAATPGVRQISIEELESKLRDAKEITKS